MPKWIIKNKNFSPSILLKIISAFFILVGLPVGVFLAIHPTIFDQFAAQRTILATNGRLITAPSAVFEKNGVWGSGYFKIGGVITNQTLLLPQRVPKPDHILHDSYNITRIAPLPSVQDQGAIGSCVAWTTDYYMRGWYAMRNGNYPRDGREGFAPMYTFSKIEHRAKGLVGSSMPENFDILISDGVATRKDYPYLDTDWQHIPNNTEDKNAANYKISGYKTLFSGGPFTNPTLQTNVIRTLEAAIRNNNPVGITLVVNNNFMSAGANTPMPIDATGGAVSPTDPNEHVVTLWGYNDTHDTNNNYTTDSGFWMINSWGLGWGINGKSLLSMNFIKNRVKNAYIITGVKPPLPTPTQPPSCERGSFCTQRTICNLNNGLTRASGNCFKMGEVCCKEIPPTPTQAKAGCTRSGGTCTPTRFCEGNCDTSHTNACMRLDCENGNVCCF